MILHEKDLNRYGYTISRIKEISKNKYSCVIKNEEHLFNCIIKKTPFCKDYHVISVDSNYSHEYQSIARSALKQGVLGIICRYLLQCIFFVAGTVTFYTLVFFPSIKSLLVCIPSSFAFAWLFLNVDSFVDALCDVIHDRKKVNYAE